ncbi:MAG: hypothetical protein IPJ90_03445 [Anaerolineaceae bacterium]|nr:hypothetical protein [Anaerolineaceae bacterium]
MEPIIRLKDFVQEMEAVGDEIKVFLNSRTGEFVTLSTEELSAAEEGKDLENFPEWQREVIQQADEVLFSSDYRELPTKFEIHEYKIMESFCYSVEDEALRRRLLNGIRGRGAFRYFKDVIYEFGIEEEWYQFREQAFKEIAIDWLESNKIAYTDEKEVG